MYSNLENAMLKHMKKKVYEESKPFSFLDFMEFKVDDKPHSPKRGTIRNKFSKFVKENKIEFCYNDGISFYTLAGKQFGKNKLMKLTTRILVLLVLILLIITLIKNLSLSLLENILSTS